MWLLRGKPGISQRSSTPAIQGTVATYRTNVGFNTVGGTAANVTVTFHNNDGTQVGVPLPFVVPGNGMMQRNLIVRDLLNSGGAVTGQNGYLRITSDQPLIAWASKIDNLRTIRAFKLESALLRLSSLKSRQGPR